MKYFLIVCWFLYVKKEKKSYFTLSRMSILSWPPLIWFNLWHFVHSKTWNTSSRTCMDVNVCMPFWKRQKDTSRGKGGEGGSHGERKRESERARKRESGRAGEDQNGRPGAGVRGQGHERMRQWQGQEEKCVTGRGRKVEGHGGKVKEIERK